VVDAVQKAEAVPHRAVGCKPVVGEADPMARPPRPPPPSIKSKRKSAAVQSSSRIRRAARLRLARPEAPKEDERAPLSDTDSNALAIGQSAGAKKLSARRAMQAG